jgi:D-glycero-D-manno-heptose 1,7-bisphosphate phosphatase
VVTKAVFLDRDGVINANMDRDGRPVAPTTIDEFQFLPDVPEAVQRIKAAGFAVVVFTNQPDIATGRTPRATVEAMHARVRQDLAVDDIRVCEHVDADNCACRKPKPGMLLDAARERGIDLAASYVVGDRWRDIEAGRRAGCLTILVDYGYEQDGPMSPDKVVRSLSEAASFIVDREQSGERT